jgi:hypothetical protein
MNGRREWLRLALFLLLIATRASAEGPDHVRPSTSTIGELRGAVAGAAESLAEHLDQFHDRLYRWLQHVIDDVDTRFAEPDSAPIVAPLSPIRFGLEADFLHRRDGFGLAGARDFEATLHVPNLERRLKLFVTNDDLQESPGDPAPQHNPVRAGLRLALRPRVEFELGARAKVWPSAFAAVRWASEFEAGAVHFSPFGKLYVESGLGSGVSGGFAVERWAGRWVVRAASYADWVHNTAAIDWAQTLIVGYARAVIQERRYDRLADGHDLACGVAARLAVNGDRVSRTNLYQVSVLYKRPLAGGWLFGYAGPTVRWDRVTSWHPDVGVGVGFDALFWGLAAQPAEVAGYCR